MRKWLTAELATHSALSLERIADAAVMVNELTNNVLVHTNGTGEVELTIKPTTVRIEVHDQSGDIPIVRPADPQRVGGNGLRVVDAWSSEWGASRRPGGGKTVWICLES